MNPFRVIDEGAEQLRILHIGADVRAEAWELSIEQCQTVAQVAALEDRLAKRVDLLRKLEAPMDGVRALQLSCAQRRNEITAGQSAPLDAAGRSPVAQAAHSGTEA